MLCACRFVEVCREFCGEQMQFDEGKIRAYYEKMNSVRGLTAHVIDSRCS